MGHLCPSSTARCSEASHRGRGGLFPHGGRSRTLHTFRPDRVRYRGHAVRVHSRFLARMTHAWEDFRVHPQPERESHRGDLSLTCTKVRGEKTYFRSARGPRILASIRTRKPAAEELFSRGQIRYERCAAQDGHARVVGLAWNLRASKQRPSRRSGRLILQPVISISNLNKTYDSGFRALKKINLEIRRGEIFALLGPNGAGKTTLINVVCGIVNPTEGVVKAEGHDIISEFRATRSLIGLVPQELTTDAFETVWATVSFSRGLFGKPPDPGYIEKVLRDLALWDKKDDKIMTLSGGMKRRVMIAKALSHEPRILFLDEPTAGVDVELRKDMWAVVRSLRESGVTIILTTHYIEEAELMADRVGVINKGEIILIQNKAELMQKLGSKRLTIQLHETLDAIPAGLSAYILELSDDGNELIYTYDAHRERTGITSLIEDLRRAGIRFKDLHTKQSSLEEIFVNLVRRQP